MHENTQLKKPLMLPPSARKMDAVTDSTKLLYCCILELRPVPVCDPPPSTGAMPFKGTVREL